MGGDIDNRCIIRLEQGSLEMTEGPLDIVSIAGVAMEASENPHPVTGKQPCDLRLPVFCDIRESERNTWRLFPPEDYFYPHTVDEHGDCYPLAVESRRGSGVDTSRLLLQFLNNSITRAYSNNFPTIADQMIHHRYATVDSIKFRIKTNATAI
jgi:hypothetical protein